MIKNIAKNHVCKIVVAMFCLLMLVHGQCGYAGIEKYLIPVSSHLYKLGTEDRFVRVGKMELAAEIESYLRNGRLREIHIRVDQDSIKQVILRAIIEELRENKALTILDLRSNKIGDEGFKALAESLCTNRTLTTLDLWDNNIGPESMRSLVDMLHTNTTLTMLGLGHNNIGTEGAEILAGALRSNATLTRLTLTGNEIGIDGIRAIADALHNNTTLTVLSLGRNSIGSEGADVLAEFLRTNNKLIALYLWGNDIGTEGARILAEALRTNNALTVLDLGNPSRSIIGPDAVKILIDNYSLLELHGDYNLCKKILLRNNQLIKLLHKVKRANAFTFAIGFHNNPLRDVAPNILGFAGLNIHNRPRFGNIQDYNNEGIRDKIFNGTLEDIIRLFYFGNNADYRGILREVNIIRRLQMEILLENRHEVPSEMLELPEDLPIGTVLLKTEGQIQQQSLVEQIFWGSS